MEEYTITQFITDASSLITAMFGWMADALEFIVSNPLTLVPAIFGLVAIGILFVKRFI